MRADIRFITRKWPPAMGGMETYCRELVDGLSAEHRIDLIALPGQADGSVPSPWAMLIFGLKAVVRLLFSPFVPIVHAGDLSIWPLAWVAALRHPDSRIFISVHGSDVNFATGSTARARAYRAYLGLGARCLKRAQLIANSRWIAECARDRGFARVTVVPLATGLRPDTVPIGHTDSLFYAGRITAAKGLPFLVKSVLPRLDPGLRLLVAGTVWDSDAATVLASPQVEFLGMLGPEALADEYGRALCTLVPSQTPEGFGLVAAEAAACGAVVIAADHSGLAEVVTPDLGICVSTSDVPAWAAAIIAVRGWSGADRTAFVTQSMEMAQTRYCWDRVVAATIATYAAAPD